MAAAGTAPFNKVERAHQMYRGGRYSEALEFYSDALSIAKTTAQKIALHSNRAACFLKLHNFQKAADECSFVLELDHNHTGALMLRAQTLVTLKEYQSALFDVNRLLELNPSSEVYLNLQTRLKSQLSLAPIPEAETELEEEEDEDVGDDMPKGCKELEEEIEREQKKEDHVVTKVENTEPKVHASNGFIVRETNDKEFSHPPSQRWERKVENTQPKVHASNGFIVRETNDKEFSHPPSQGFGEIRKPLGHSRLDYSRWDNVADCSSEDEDDDEEDTQPQYRFRVKTVDLRPVK